MNMSKWKTQRKCMMKHQEKPQYIFERKESQSPAKERTLVWVISPCQINIWYSSNIYLQAQKKHTWNSIQRNMKFSRNSSHWYLINRKNQRTMAKVTENFRSKFQVSKLFTSLIHTKYQTLWVHEYEEAKKLWKSYMFIHKSYNKACANSLNILFAYFHFQQFNFFSFKCIPQSLL